MGGTFRQLGNGDALRAPGPSPADSARSLNTGTIQLIHELPFTSFPEMQLLLFSLSPPFAKVQGRWVNFGHVSGRRSWHRSSPVAGRATDRAPWLFDGCRWGAHILHYVIARGKKRNIGRFLARDRRCRGVAGSFRPAARARCGGTRSREVGEPRSRSLATTGCCGAGAEPISMPGSACDTGTFSCCTRRRGLSLSLSLRKWPPLLLRPCRQPKVCARTKTMRDTAAATAVTGPTQPFAATTARV